MAVTRVPLTYNGVTYHLEFDITALKSPEVIDLIDQMQGAENLEEKQILHRDALFRVLVGWDVQGPDGQALPITDESLDAHVPWFFERLMLQALIDHGRRLGKVLRPTQGPRFTPSPKVQQKKRKGKRR